MSDDAIFPPERFANLLRDAGINSPEALMQFLRGGSQTEGVVAKTDTTPEPDKNNDLPK